MKQEKRDEGATLTRLHPSLLFASRSLLARALGFLLLIVGDVLVHFVGES